MIIFQNTSGIHVYWPGYPFYTWGESSWVLNQACHRARRGLKNGEIMNGKLGNAEMGTLHWIPPPYLPEQLVLVPAALWLPSCQSELRTGGSNRSSAQWASACAHVRDEPHNHATFGPFLGGDFLPDGHFSEVWACNTFQTTPTKGKG